MFFMPYEFLQLSSLYR